MFWPCCYVNKLLFSELLSAEVTKGFMESWAILGNALFVAATLMYCLQCRIRVNYYKLGKAFSEGSVPMTK